jgi:SsrA-binding protein
MSLIQNKKAGFNYEVQDKYEAGIELLGFEVKSINNKLGKLDGAYISIRGGEAFLIGSEIPPFQPKNTPDDYDPARVRKLLLTKKELLKLTDLEKQKRLTLIPISLYNKGRKIKLEFAVAVGKNKSDKRNTLQKRESDREIERTLKNQR